MEAVMEKHVRPSRIDPALEGCSFCKIVRGESRAYLVFEDAESIAFLDHHPLLPGHVLLIPRQHYPTLADVPKSLLLPLFANVQTLARAVEEGYAADGSFIAINTKVSQSIPHLHIHIVPRWRKDGLFARDLVWKRVPYENEAAIVAMQNQLRSAIARLQSSGR
jgi:histidine triad (HIT) family protein